MQKEYAIELRDCCGNARHWSDAYPTAKLACDAARDILKDRPLGWRAKVFIRTSPGGQIGAAWQEFRSIK